MTKFVFTDTNNGQVIENFPVSLAFWDIMDVLQEEKPGIFETFNFHLKENDATIKHSIEPLQKFFDSINFKKTTNTINAINEAKKILNGNELKIIFESVTSEIGSGMEKKIACSKVKKTINDILSILNKEPKYTRRYRFSGNDGVFQFTARSLNGIFVNSKRVYLQGGTGKCSMSVYNENNDGYSEIIDISSIKSLETSEGIIKIVSTKIRLPEINSLNSVLSKLDVYKDDAVISFGIRWE